MPSDDALLGLMHAIVNGDRDVVDALVGSDPALVTAVVATGATRADPHTFFLDVIRHHVYRGDTATHIAAAAHSPEIVRALVSCGAAVDAVNRRGAQPLHYAADGGPSAARWDPNAQRATIVCLLELGADADALDRNGTTPLLRAIRNRCADAVEALIVGGADVRATNGSGSTASDLAKWTTGRGGSGSPAARAEQERILALLRAAGAGSAD